jgi:nucleoside recognition membrane protein YjiH
MVKKYKNCGNNILFVIMGLLITSFCIMFIIYLINVISKNKDIYIEEEEEETCNQCKGK